MKNLIKHLLYYKAVSKPPCNVLDPTTAAILVGGSLGSAVLGSFSANKQNKDSYKYNSMLMQQQQNYNVSNMTHQYNFNNRLLRDSYEYENEYNSPSAQRKRMEEAGLNPYYNEQGAIAAQSQPTPQDVSQPSSSIPNFQAASPFGAFANMPNDFAQIATAFKALADAKKTGVETDNLETFANYYAELLENQLKGSKLANEYQEVVNKYADQRLDFEQQKVMNEALKLAAEAKYTDSLRFLTDEERKFKKANRELFEETKDFLKKKAEAEANEAEERVITTRKQGIMYDKQGNAATQQAIAARITANAAYKQAVTAEENGLSYRINLSEASKLSKAQRLNLIENSISLYEDETGVQLNEHNRQFAVQQLTSLMESQSRYEYWQSVNPLTYLGAIFGGAMAIGAKAIK